MTQYVINGIKLANPGEPGGVDTKVADMRGIDAVYAAGILNALALKEGGTRELIAITRTDIPDDAAALKIAAEIADLEGIASVGEVHRVVRIEPLADWYRKTAEG